MRKTFYLVLVFVGLMLFAGCSQNVDMQTVPEFNQSPVSVLSSASNNESGIEELSDSSVVDIIEQDGTYYITEEGEAEVDPAEYHIINITAYSHYLHVLMDLIEMDAIEFKNDKMSNAYANKLIVLINMIDSGNYHAATQKGFHDIYKLTHSWISNEAQLTLIDTILYLTNWMVENQQILYESNNWIPWDSGHKTERVFKDGIVIHACEYDYVIIFGIEIRYNTKCTDNVILDEDNG